jgi:hypothetical protein
LPQTGLQLLSLIAFAPAGQQPSPFLGVTTGMCVHFALHLAELPTISSVVQGSPSSHVAGHVLGGSHVSPASSVPFPQLGEQSESLIALQPSGQHESFAAQAVIRVFLHSAVQVAASPTIVCFTQASCERHVCSVGQSPSQVSPRSTIPLPQIGARSAAAPAATAPAAAAPLPVAPAAAPPLVAARLSFAESHYRRRFRRV